MLLILDFHHHVKADITNKPKAKVLVLVYVGYMTLAVFTRHLDEDMGFSLFFEKIICILSKSNCSY